MYLQQKLLKTIIIGAIALIVSGGVCSGQQAHNEKLDELLSLYNEYGKFNGSVLVADQGKVVYKKGFGFANMEWDIPNAPNTKHRLGSVTKQFTAMLILQQAAKGTIDLHAPITTYLTDYPKSNGEKITTHHLLTHTAGLPNYTAFPGFFNNLSRDHYSPNEFVDVFKDKDLEFPPGDNINYSNSGYFLLGVILEKVTGKTYETLLHDDIFKPLGMKDSGYDNHEDILPNRATGYEKDGNTFINSSYLDMSIPYAAGSLYSTVEDLYLWDQALYTTKLVPQKYMDLFFQPHVEAFGGHYAYGWIISTEALGKSQDSIVTISHGGGINGFNTNISRATSDKSLVVLLNNTGGAALSRMTRNIRAVMNGKPYKLPKKSLANTVSNVIQAKGLEAGLAHYDAYKDSDDFDLDENEMNQLGYQLMGEEKIKEASEIFRLNTEAFPKSSNVYDSYAEALMGLGKNEAAIKNYTTSVEMDPSNEHGIAMLKDLGVDTKDLVKEVIVPAGILESYLGRYELMPNFIITVFQEDGQMKAQATGQSALDIFPQSNDKFYMKVVEAQLGFNFDKNGKVESVTLFQNGMEQVGKRLQD